MRALLLPLSVAMLSGCDANLPEAGSPAAQLYAERCTGCHRLYAPGVLTQEMWRITVARMQGELARRGVRPLDVGEQALLLDYLSRHSSDQEG